MKPYYRKGSVPPMNDAWKQDPRLKSMNPEKIKFLTDFTEQLNRTPKDQMMARFLSLSTEASQKNISFTDQETKLLTEILLTHMNPADKGKMDMLRTLSQKLAFRRG